MNPTLERAEQSSYPCIRFDLVTIGHEFDDINGVRWRKLSEFQAEILTPDYGLSKGDLSPFKPSEEVML